MAFSLNIATRAFGAFLILFPVLTLSRVYQRCELAQELRYVHGIPLSQLPTWICIAQHESQFDTTAKNPGSGDHGIFQISEIFWCSVTGQEVYACGLPCAAFRDDDITDDVECVKKIYEEHEKISGDGYDAWIAYRDFCKNSTRLPLYIAGCFDDENTVENELIDDSEDFEQFKKSSHNSLNDLDRPELDFLKIAAFAHEKLTANPTYDSNIPPGIYYNPYEPPNINRYDQFQENTIRSGGELIYGRPRAYGARQLDVFGRNKEIYHKESIKNTNDNASPPSQIHPTLPTTVEVKESTPDRRYPTQYFANTQNFILNRNQSFDSISPKNNRINNYFNNQIYQKSQTLGDYTTSKGINESPSKVPKIETQKFGVTGPEKNNLQYNHSIRDKVTIPKTSPFPTASSYKFENVESRKPKTGTQPGKIQNLNRFSLPIVSYYRNSNFPNFNNSASTAKSKEIQTTRIFTPTSKPSVFETESENSRSYENENEPRKFYYRPIKNKHKTRPTTPIFSTTYSSTQKPSISSLTTHKTTTSHYYPPNNLHSSSPATTSHETTTSHYYPPNHLHSSPPSPISHETTTSHYYPPNNLHSSSTTSHYNPPNYVHPSSQVSNSHETTTSHYYPPNNLHSCPPSPISHETTTSHYYPPNNLHSSSTISHYNPPSYLHPSSQVSNSHETTTSHYYPPNNLHSSSTAQISYETTTSHYNPPSYLHPSSQVSNSHETTTSHYYPPNNLHSSSTAPISYETSTSSYNPPNYLHPSSQVSNLYETTTSHYYPPNNLHSSSPVSITEETTTGHYKPPDYLHSSSPVSTSHETTTSHYYPPNNLLSKMKTHRPIFPLFPLKTKPTRTSRPHFGHHHNHANMFLSHIKGKDFSRELDAPEFLSTETTTKSDKGRQSFVVKPGTVYAVVNENGYVYSLRSNGFKFSLA